MAKLSYYFGGTHVDQTATRTKQLRRQPRIASLTLSEHAVETAEVEGLCYAWSAEINGTRSDQQFVDDSILVFDQIASAYGNPLAQN